MRREERGEAAAVQVIAVVREAQRGGELRRRRGAGEAVEGRVEQRGQDLPRAVGAEIEAEQPVAVAQAGVAGQHRGGHELVRHVARVGGLHGGRGALRALAFSHGDGAPGLLHPLPPVVAVHGEVAARDGGEPRAGRQLGVEPGEVDEGGARRRVAAVGEGVDGDGDAGLRQRLRERHGVRLVRVDPAVGDEAQEVRGAPGVAQRADEGAQRRHRRQ